jgi:phosphate transport system permease protein
LKDRIFKAVLFSSTLVLLLLIAGILYSLVSQSIPAFQHFGFFRFICSPEWNPEKGNEQYGALSFIYGTFLTAFLALIISFPFSISLSLFNGDLYKGKKIALWTSTFVDILSGIPSIIFGIWGYYSLRPVLMSLHIGHQGYGILSAAILLALMIIPYSASICTAFIKEVPQKLKEGAYSLGATRFEVIRNISIPYAKKGIIAAHTFTLGKIVGETMIVSILIGNTNQIPSGITGTGSTMTSIILNHFGTANNLQFSSLFAIALLLFLFTAAINLVARYLIKEAML